VARGGGRRRRSEEEEEEGQHHQTDTTITYRWFVYVCMKHGIAGSLL